MLTRWFLWLCLSSAVFLAVPVQATVNESISANRYTADGVTTVFNYTFTILDETALRVLTGTTVNTVNADYTVTGVGEDAGGSVTFNDPPAAGAIITILRAQPASQLSDYQPHEAFPSVRVEKDYDKATMQIQQAKELASRSYHIPEQETGSEFLSLMPSLLNRANKFFAWGPSGEPTASSGTGGSGGGSSSVTPTWGLVASFIADLFGRELWVTDFGAVGTANDAAVVQLALDAVATHGNGVLHWACAVHNIGTTVLVHSNTTLKSCGIGVSIVRATSSLPLKDPMLMGATGDTGLNIRVDENISIYDTTFDGIGRDYPAWDVGTTGPNMYGGLTPTNARGNLIRFYSATNIKLIGNEFMNHESLGVSLAGSKGVLVSHNVFHGNGKIDDVSPALYVPNGSFPNGTPSADIIVSDNYFYDNNRSAMLFNPDGGGSVVHNRFTDNSESTIFSEGGSDILISDNYIIRSHLTDITAHGIEINSCVNCQVTNNVIRNVDATCITGNGATNMKVANNTCINPGQATVYPGGPFNFTAGRAPGDPYSDANRSCIKFTAGNFFINEVDISNNKCVDDQGSPTMQFGISLVRAGSTYLHTNMSITDNRVQGAVQARYNFVANACSTSVKLRDKGWPHMFEIQVPAATGPVTYSIGYRPTYVRASAMTSSTSVVWSASGAVMWGATSAAIAERGQQFASEETGPNMFSDHVNSQLLQMVNGSNVVQMQANFTDWTDDGFTIDWTTVTNRPYVMFEVWP